MEQLTPPSKAYDLLEQHERQAVDEYVTYAKNRQYHSRQRIALAIEIPIPSEMVRRSKGVLAKPLARAAVCEKLTEAANEQDISPDRVIQEHASIAFSNIVDFLDKGPFGDFSIKALDSIPRQLFAAVKSMKTIPSPYGMRTEITLHDKLPSLKTLSELMGLVSPDAPPVLAEYSKPKSVEQALNLAPETAYATLLEAGRA